MAENDAEALDNYASSGRRSEEVPRQSSRKIFTPARLRQTKSSVDIALDLEKPLPPTPSNPQAWPLLDSIKSRTKEQTTKTGLLLSRKASRKVSKAMILTPTNAVLEPSPTVSNSPRRENDHLSNLGSILAGPADAKELRNKIRHVRVQAVKEKPLQRRELDSAVIENAPRISRLQRGKEAFVKAGRAFIKYLNGQSNHKSRTGDKTLDSTTKLAEGSNENVPPVDPTVNEDDNRRRFRHKIGEGGNLSKPGDQCVGGEDRLRGKSSPLSQGINSNSLSLPSDGLVDPLLDATESEATVSQRFFDTNLESSSPGCGTSSRSNYPSTISEPHLIASWPDNVDTSKYSSHVSGLKQHPHNVVFSSAPVDCSSPEFIEAPATAPSSSKRLAMVSMPRSATYNAPHKDWMGDECANEKDSVSSKFSGLGKRYTRDLRSQILPS